MSLYDDLRSVLDALDRAPIDYALAGGLAVAVWGAPRATEDIDLLVRPEDLPRTKGALRPLGFTLEGLPFHFKDGLEVHRINKVDSAGDVVTVDLLVVDDSLEPVWAARTRLRLADGEVVVVSRDGLIAMKARAARPQDIADLQSLKELDR